MSDLSICNPSEIPLTERQKVCVYYLSDKMEATAEMVGKAINPIGWTKTHIMTQQVAGGGDWGMQILRFHGDSADGEWDLAINPYAGVYLKPDEWQKVCGKLL